MFTQRYMHQYGATAHDLAQVRALEVQDDAAAGTLRRGGRRGA